MIVYHLCEMMPQRHWTPMALSRENSIWLIPSSIRIRTSKFNTHTHKTIWIYRIKRERIPKISHAVEWHNFVMSVASKLDSRGQLDSDRIHKPSEDIVHRCFSLNNTSSLCIIFISESVLILWIYLLSWNSIREFHRIWTVTVFID